jgi:hypothetical protein
MQFALAARHYISDRRKQRTAASRTAGSSATPAARMARLTTFKTLKTGIGFEGFEGSGSLMGIYAPLRPAAARYDGPGACHLQRAIPIRCVS